MKELWILLCLSSAVLGAEALSISEVKRDAPVDFAKDIYPLLKRSCLACHNTTKAKAGLNLESPQTILKGGDNGPAAKEGKGLESLLLRSAAHLEDSVMPPPSNKVNAAALTPDELGLVRLWIDQGVKGSAVTEQVAEWRSFPSQSLPIATTAMSSNGRIVAAGRGNQVQLMEVATNLPLGQLVDPELAKLDLYKDKAAADRDAVMSVAFGGDDLMATGGFRTVRLWRRAPWSDQRPIIDLPSDPTCLTTDAQRTAFGDATGVIRVWEFTKDQPAVQEWKEHTTPVKALCFSNDSHFLISAAADRSLRVWATVTQQVVFRGETPTEVTALCFLKNGTELAVASVDGILRVYPFTQEFPAAMLAPLREGKLADQPPVSVTALEPAGTQVLWINPEPALHFIETLDWKRLPDVPLENPAQQSIANLERRQQAAQRTLDARKARFTTAVEAAKKEMENLRATHQAQEKTRSEWQRKLAVSQAADEGLRASPDDQPTKDVATKATTELKTAERVFTDARTNAELAVRLSGQALQTQAASEAAATAAETTVSELVAGLDGLKKAFTPLPAPRALTLLNDGKAALVVFDNKRVQWHSTASGELLDTTDLKSPPLLIAANNRSVIVTRPDHKLVTLPLRRPFRLERTWGTPEDAAIFANRVTALSFSSDARLLATGGGVPSRSGEAKIWNVSDGTLALSIPNPHSDNINALAFSPDDSLLGTAGSDRWARVFSAIDGHQTAAFEGHSGQVLSIAWRGDGLALATGGADKTLRLWDLLDNKQIKSMASFGKEVSSVAWLGATDTVASASGDAAVRLNEETLPGNKGFCFTLATDPAGKFVSVGGEDGMLRIWLTATKKLLQEVPQ